MALIAYARVSTDEQTTAPPTDVLRRAGCSVIFEERASGADRERPQLRLAIERCRRGDVLVVVRIGRLARSLSHLLARASRGLGCKRPQPFRSRFGLDFEELTEVGTPNL
jgi:DNA invertase Pin-like site-specific DNA recombinase